jgi:prolyl oligopeptidase
VIPGYEAPAQTTAYYQPSASDGSRAGLFMINTYKLETRPKYEMEALTLHESVPGHHLQIARAQELNGLPEFRRNAGYTAYVEGWGLYAESLGSEMGFYADPYSRFGQLTYEMWRACRLVVDTGMHAFGWSRQQAIDLMKENTAKTENDIIVEVDRYIVWPGQALAYMIGSLKIKELRARASKELGARFDVRKFHNAVLDDGPLPLDLLDERLTAWIAEQKRKE